ncbi:MAG: DNA-entry nuclease, partial [Leuconostoc pseudomesenteroides]
MARKRTYTRRKQPQNKLLSLLIIVLVAGFYLWQNQQQSNTPTEKTSRATVNAPNDQALLNLKWDGTLDGDIVHVNNNKATFSETEMADTFPSQASKLRPIDGLSLS